MDLLQQIPANSNTIDFVFLVNFAHVRQVMKIPALSAGASVAEVRREVEQLKNTPGVYYAHDDEFRFDSAEAIRVNGFSRASIDAEATTPGHIVVHGRFDPAAIDRALRADTGSRDYLRTEDYYGTAYYTWPTAQLRGGVPGPTHAVAVGPKMVLYAHTLARGDTGRAHLEAMIDSTAKRKKSLAETAHFADVAQAVAELGAISFAVSTYKLTTRSTNINQLWRQEYGTAKVEALLKEPLLKPYEAWAAGWARQGEQSVVVLAFSYASAPDATASAEALRQRVATGRSFKDGTVWSQMFASADVQAKGMLVTATLRTDRPGSWVDIANNLDNLWASE